ncbi:MAG: insulinase family protein [Myxococcales bacterium]|nr:insulinase family protein [Myxococcales bacterium]
MTRLAVAALAIAACCPTLPRAASTPIARPIASPPPPGEPGPPPAPPPLDWGAAGIDWTAPPAAGPEVTFAPPVPTEFRLRNGARVLVVENHRLPLVSVRIAVESAGARSDGAKPGLAALTADLLDEGAGTRSALELPEEIERLGARLTVGTGSDATVLTLDTLAATLAPSLALAADVLLRPRLTGDDFARIKAERLADLALRVDQPTVIARLVFDRVVYGAHPYAAPTDGEAASVAAITAADVTRFFRTHYGPAAATVVIVGDVSVDDARRMLEASFGAWKGKAARPTRPPAPVAARPTLAFVDRPGAPQSVVAIGRLGPDTADPAQAANDLVNTALGGSFASRLNTALREEKGYTYGVGSQFLRNQWAGFWRVFSQIRTDVTVPAIKDALAIIAATAAAPLPPDELAKTKALIVRGLPQGFETNAGIAGAYLGLALDGRPLTYFRDLPDALAAVTGDAGQRAAAAAWHDLTIVVVGDGAVIGADLATLGLPIVRYDADGRPRP